MGSERANKGVLWSRAFHLGCMDWLCVPEQSQGRGADRILHRGHFSRYRRFWREKFRDRALTSKTRCRAHCEGREEEEGRKEEVFNAAPDGLSQIHRLL